jgi:6-phosphogluconolactonase
MIHQFPSKAAMNQALCERINKDLQKAIKEKGEALLLLSGGSTPYDLYRLLSLSRIEWEKVKIGLVDERFVAPDHESSNEKMLRSTILNHEAEKATFYSMVVNPNDESENLNAILLNYNQFQTADVVILGMGDDGHTASIFPNDSDSELALKGENKLYYTNAPKFPNRRLTCSGELLKNSAQIYLMITGTQKLEIFENAAIENLPIAAFQPFITATYFSI